MESTAQCSQKPVCLLASSLPKPRAQFCSRTPLAATSIPASSRRTGLDGQRWKDAVHQGCGEQNPPSLGLCLCQGLYLLCSAGSFTCTAACAITQKEEAILSAKETSPCVRDAPPRGGGSPPLQPTPVCGQTLEMSPWGLSRSHQVHGTGPGQDNPTPNTHPGLPSPSGSTFPGCPRHMGVQGYPKTMSWGSRDGRRTGLAANIY